MDDSIRQYIDENMVSKSELASMMADMTRTLAELRDSIHAGARSNPISNRAEHQNTPNNNNNNACRRPNLVNNNQNPPNNNGFDMMAYFEQMPSLKQAIEQAARGYDLLETQKLYGRGNDVVTYTFPFSGVAEKVFIKDGMILEEDQPCIHVKALAPPFFAKGLDMSSESVKLGYKERHETHSRVAGCYPIQDVVVPAADDDQTSSLSLPLDYGKQDVIENFKRFDTVTDHSDHLFSAYTPPAAVQQPDSDWANAIKEEWRFLEQNLPDTIFVRVYEQRMDLLRAAIVGPDGTPYQGGLFFFDLYFPNDYPNSPPLVRYRSHCLGINPNLKMCGEVCLSLFASTPEEQHLLLPGTRILKLLISIQMLIFNPKPLYNSYERMRCCRSNDFSALLYNENTIVKSLMTMAHTMNKPPKNFEDLVVGHFRKRLPDILRSCKAYMEGLQVGCLVNDYNHTCSLEFKNEVASCIKPLVDAFNKVGANETQEFLHLITEKNAEVDDYMSSAGVNKKRKVVVDEDHLSESSNKRIEDDDACHDGLDLQVMRWTMRSHSPASVVKVLVKDGMKLEPGQPLYVKKFKMEDFETKASRPRPESRTRRILELNHSSHVGIFCMEDVLIDQDGAGPDSRPLAGHDKNGVLTCYKNFKKFEVVMDHADHFFSANNSAMNQMPEHLAGKIQEEWRILEEQLPETIYVRAYKSRTDLLRAVIIGPDGTPYHGGLFFFDVCFPSNYPDSPPLVHYHSGGMGINPNLFSCGEVCLNVPTKSGGRESMWVPGTTTMIQLLVSIQNQILKADPLFNEPAYATLKGSSYGKHASFLYNETVRIKSLKTMVYTINKPPKNFEAFVDCHFRIHARNIYLSAWNKEPYSSTFKKDLLACKEPLVDAFKKTGLKEEELEIEE